MSDWKPEILAPAGSPDCLPAAVAGGADAVYLGLRHFNARGRAENFRLADLPQHMAYLHHHGLKGYVVFNTLLHDDEFTKAVDMAARAHAAGIDAVLVQDIGLWSQLRQLLPDLELHASTQMTVHCQSQVDYLAAQGAQRIVLARELSIDEVRCLSTYAAERGVETEHFIHGALCYAFSGQCLMSNFSGCRSANRGTCAQNCRYDYRADNQADYDTSISMKDFNVLSSVGMLADAGVACLKIEGRLKGPDYVYTTARSYRHAVDAWAAQQPYDDRDDQAALKNVFSRGYSSAPLEGIYDQRSRLSRQQQDGDARADARLLQLDRQGGRALLESVISPEPGQGFAFTVGQFRGGFLVTASGPGKKAQQWQCRIRMQEQGPRLPVPLALYKNADQRYQQEIAREIKRWPLQDVAAPTIGLALTVSGAVGEPLQLEAQHAVLGLHCCLQSDQQLQAARQRGLDEEQLRRGLASLGNSHYHCDTLDHQLEPDAFLPLRSLKQLRRAMVAALDEQRDGISGSDSAVTVSVSPVTEPERRTTAVIAAVSSLAAAEAALAAGADRVCLDDPLLDLWAEQAPALQLPEGVLLRHPPTRLVSPHLQQLGVPLLGGHMGVLQRCQELGLPAVADHYCNTVNSFSLEALGALGVEAAVISLECSAREIARLAGRCSGRSLPALWLCVHGRLPSMLTRQDHGLEAGQDMEIRAHARDGGLPYTVQRRLDRDTVIWEGRRLLAPAAVQHCSGLVDGWLLELADCDIEAVTAFTAAYGRLRDGEAVHDELVELARRHYRHGTFVGHLETGSRALDGLQTSS